VGVSYIFIWNYNTKITSKISKLPENLEEREELMDILIEKKIENQSFKGKNIKWRRKLFYDCRR